MQWAKMLFLEKKKKIKVDIIKNMRIEINETPNVIPKDTKGERVEIHEKCKQCIHCTQCDFVTVDPNMMKGYMIGQKSTSFICTKCKKTFSSKDDLRNHTAAHNTSNTPDNAQCAQ